jgi:hypothetical protein
MINLLVDVYEDESRFGIVKNRLMICRAEYIADSAVCHGFGRPIPKLALFIQADTILVGSFWLCTRCFETNSRICIKR